MSAERRFKICQHLKRVNPLHLVLTATYLKGPINPVLVLKLPVLCPGSVSVGVSWAWLWSISTCWMPSSPDLSTRGFFACKSLRLPASYFPLQNQHFQSDPPLPASKRLLRTRVYQSDPLSRQLAGFPISRSSALINSFVQTSSNSAKCLR